MDLLEKIKLNDYAIELTEDEWRELWRRAMVRVPNDRFVWSVHEYWQTHEYISVKQMYHLVDALCRPKGRCGIRKDSNKETENG